MFNSQRTMDRGAQNERIAHSRPLIITGRSDIAVHPSGLLMILRFGSANHISRFLNPIWRIPPSSVTESANRCGQLGAEPDQPASARNHGYCRATLAKEPKMWRPAINKSQRSGAPTGVRWKNPDPPFREGQDGLRAWPTGAFFVGTNREEDRSPGGIARYCQDIHALASLATGSLATARRQAQPFSRTHWVA